MKTAINHELINNLRRAASFDAYRTYPVLFQHLGYRKFIAEKLLERDDPDLRELYNHVTGEIKLILGI